MQVEPLEVVGVIQIPTPPNISRPECACYMVVLSRHPTAPQLVSMAQLLEDHARLLGEDMVTGKLQ